VPIGVLATLGSEGFRIRVSGSGFVETTANELRSRVPSPSSSHVRYQQTGNQKAEAMEAHDDDTLLTPSEVAAMFRVNPKTVTRWARAGKISAIRTLGGHRRFRASEIRHFLENVEEADRI
jgi:excisionase family DNA binding protein